MYFSFGSYKTQSRSLFSLKEAAHVAYGSLGGSGRGVTPFVIKDSKAQGQGSEVQEHPES